MPRRSYTQNKSKRNLLDVKNHNADVQDITLMLMRGGNYSTIYRLVCCAVDDAYNHFMKEHYQAKKVTNTPDSESSDAVASKEPLSRQAIVELMMNDVLRSVSPKLELKTKRFGGANYQVPQQCDELRSRTLGLRFLVKAARSRKDVYGIDKKLAAEFKDALQGKGGAVREKETLFRMAKANMVHANIKRGG